MGEKKGKTEKIRRFERDIQVGICQTQILLLLMFWLICCPNRFYLTLKFAATFKSWLLTFNICDPELVCQFIAEADKGNLQGAIAKKTQEPRPFLLFSPDAFRRQAPDRLNATVIKAALSWIHTSNVARMTA